MNESDVFRRLKNVGSDMPNDCLINDAASEIERLISERDALLELLARMVDLAEFWINREDLRGMSEEAYKTWHKLGHGSNVMRNARAAIDAASAAGK